MKLKALLFISCSALLLPHSLFAMGKGPVNYLKSSGQSQAQFTAVSEKHDGYLLIRGHAAQTIYSYMQVPKEYVEDGDIRGILGKNIKQMVREGTVITCGEVAKNQSTEYACSVKLVDGYSSSFAAYREPFDWKTFNLAMNYGGPNLFKRKMAPNRSLASVSETGPSASGNVDIFFIKQKDNKKKTKIDSVLLLLSGSAAHQIYKSLASSNDPHIFSKGSGKGYRGRDIACVHPGDKITETNVRCSFTVSLKDGGVVREYNPLFNY